MSDDYNLSDRDLTWLLDELEAAYFLLPWLDESEQRWQVRREITRRVKADKALLKPLLELIHQSSNIPVRCDLIEILGWAGHPEAVKPLLERLYRDKDFSIRKAIAMALNRIGTPEAQAAHRRFRDTLLAYPEIVGQVAEWAQQRQASLDELCTTAMSNLAYQFWVARSRHVHKGEAGDTILWDMVEILDERVWASRWFCRGISCTGRLADELLAVAEQGLIISGPSFAYILSNLDRIAVGELYAIGDDDQIGLIIQAKNGPRFKFWSAEPDLIGKFEPHFELVVAIKQEAD